MNSEILGITLLFVLTVVAAIPLSRYCVKVFKGEKTWLDFLAPFEKFIFRLCGIDAGKPMDWKENLKASLILNVIFFAWAMLVLLTQSWHPFWNPDGIA